jgi:hypothetical protein
MTVMGATAWARNADMIIDCVNLGYIRPDDKVIDLTFGRGKWWTKYDHTRTGEFTAVTEPLSVDEVNEAVEFGRVVMYRGDFRHLPAQWANLYDVVTFDPPYIAMGGRKTSKLPDFMDRYGLEDAPTTPRALHEYNAQGLAEAYRICKPGGFVMTKCADYISSGQLQLASHWMLDSGLKLGFKVQDKLTHIGNVRPQPRHMLCPDCDNDHATGRACDKCGGTGVIPRSIKHARQNTSVLWVFQKPTTRKKKA